MSYLYAYALGMKTEKQYICVVPVCKGLYRGVKFNITFIDWARF